MFGLQICSCTIISTHENGFSKKAVTECFDSKNVSTGEIGMMWEIDPLMTTSSQEGGI